MNRLQGKTAVITGSGRGIGEAIATTFGANGATVIATDIDGANAAGVAERIAATGGVASSMELDVTRPEDWSKLAATLPDGLDVLVHNAGMEWVVPYEDIKLEDWRRVMAVNVESVFLGSQTLLEPLKKAAANNEPGASIVVISSIAGQIGYPDQAAYNTSKAAVRHLSKTLAVEFAAKGFNIRVNSIHPGAIDTPMLQEAMEGWAKCEIFGTNDMDVVRREVAALHPLNKLGRPVDIANGALYLASDEARFVTGIELTIDGGWIAR